MTKHLLQNLWILLLALLTLGLALLLVLDAIPAKTSGLEVKERVEASSALISAENKVYISSVQGYLRNATNQKVKVDQITVVVSDGDGNQKSLTLEGAELAPYAELEVSQAWVFYTCWRNNTCPIKFFSPFILIIIHKSNYLLILKYTFSIFIK